jgi:hydrogenase maturation protease
VTGRVLVAGVGNIFLADDGFGVEVARRLCGVPMPEGVEVSDFGIRGVHLAYQLLDGYDALVLVDAVQRGDEPGVLSVIEPDLDDMTGQEGEPAAVDAHGMDPASVLRLLASLGGHVDVVRVVGCEPARLEEEIGLSAEVSAAVPAAIDLVTAIVTAIVTEISSSARVEVGMGAGPSRPIGKKEGGM